MRGRKGQFEKLGTYSSRKGGRGNYGRGNEGWKVGKLGGMRGN